MNQTDDIGGLVRTNIRLMSNIFYPTIMSIGVIGNILVIIVILKKKDMLNSTNIFLANLAIADLVLLLGYGTAQLVDVNSKQGLLEYGPAICTTVAFIRCLVTNTSAITILAISFERYYAICKPLKAGYVCVKSRAYRICQSTWVFVFICNSIYVPFTHHTRTENGASHNKPFCWKVTNSTWKKAVHISNVSLFFFIPLITLTVIFLKIALHLKKATVPNIHTAANRHRKRVVVMLATVVVCFFVCLLPSRIFFSLAFVAPEVMGLEKRYYLYNLSCYLLYLHAALNPILYNLLSKRFREGFQQIYNDVTEGMIRCVRKIVFARKDKKENNKIVVSG